METDSRRNLPRWIPPNLPGRTLPRAFIGSFGRLLVALVALILLAPLLVDRERWIALVGVLSAAVLLAGLHAARPERSILVLGLALALLDFGVGRLAMRWGTRGLLFIDALFWLIMVLGVTAAILDVIFATRRITLETLLASLCIYLLIGLIGTYAFAMIELTIPGSFQTDGGGTLSWGPGTSNAKSFIKLMSMSYATLSGAGTTELGPARAFAVNAVSLEALVGQVYLAVVIARLVVIETESEKKAMEERPPGT